LGFVHGEGPHRRQRFVFEDAGEHELKGARTGGCTASSRDVVPADGSRAARTPPGCRSRRSACSPCRRSVPAPRPADRGERTDDDVPSWIMPSRCPLRSVYGSPPGCGRTRRW
jgi:hypothetical protein